MDKWLYSPFKQIGLNKPPNNYTILLARAYVYLLSFVHGKGAQKIMNTRNMFDGKRLLNKSEFCNYIGLGHTRAEEWAVKNGVVRHIGRRVLYDRVLIDKVLDSLPCEKE